MHRTLDRRLRARGISVSHVPVLLMLAEQDGLSQKELVRRAAIEQPAMVAILKRMEASGLVTRRLSPTDARSRLFHLTEQARALLPTLYEAVEAGNYHAVDGLNDGERKLLIDLLTRVIANLSP